MVPMWEWCRRGAFHGNGRWAAIGSASGEFSFSTSLPRQWTTPSVPAWPAQQHQGHFLLHISESVAVSLSPFTVTRGSMTGRNKVSNSTTHPGALLTWLSLALNFFRICRRYWKQIWLMRLMITSQCFSISFFCPQNVRNTTWTHFIVNRGPCVWFICWRHLAKCYFQALNMPRKSNIFLKIGRLDMDSL